MKRIDRRAAVSLHQARPRRSASRRTKVGVETLESRSMLATMGCSPLAPAPPASLAADVVSVTGNMEKSILVIAVPVTGFTYARSCSGVTIAGYTGTCRNVVIPASIAGLPVTGIATQAFRGSAIQTVSIPSSVRVIGADAFKDCSRLTTIDVAQGNASYLSMHGVLYTRNPRGYDTLVTCPRAKTGTVVIPYGVRTIGTNAFNGTALSVVTVPLTVTSIGTRAFYGARNLQSVQFQGNAPALQSEAFTGANRQAAVCFFTDTSGWTSSYGGLRTAGSRRCGSGPPLGPGA